MASPVSCTHGSRATSPSLAFPNAPIGIGIAKWLCLNTPLASSTQSNLVKPAAVDTALVRWTLREGARRSVKESKTVSPPSSQLEHLKRLELCIGAAGDAAARRTQLTEGRERRAGDLLAWHHERDAGR
eukprot:1032983-Prymnesium_polylepis.1